jgi:hypothetical protein
MYIDSLSIAGILVALSAAVFFVLLVRSERRCGRQDDNQ